MTRLSYFRPVPDRGNPSHPLIRCYLKEAVGNMGHISQKKELDSPALKEDLVRFITRFSKLLNPLIFISQSENSAWQPLFRTPRKKFGSLSDFRNFSTRWFSFHRAKIPPDGSISALRRIFAQKTGWSNSNSSTPQLLNLPFNPIQQHMGHGILLHDIKRLSGSVPEKQCHLIGVCSET